MAAAAGLGMASFVVKKRGKLRDWEATRKWRCRESARRLGSRRVETTVCRTCPLGGIGRRNGLKIFGLAMPFCIEWLRAQNLLKNFQLSPIQREIPLGKGYRDAGTVPRNVPIGVMS